MSIRWDEAVIEEHDKLRGTRMKIDEPDTPYEHYTMADDAEGACSRGRVRPGALHADPLACTRARAGAHPPRAPTALH